MSRALSKLSRAARLKHVSQGGDRTKAATLAAANRTAPKQDGTPGKWVRKNTNVDPVSARVAGSDIIVSGPTHTAYTGPNPNKNPRSFVMVKNEGWQNLRFNTTKDGHLEGNANELMVVARQTTALVPFKQSSQPQHSSAQSIYSSDSDFAKNLRKNFFK